MADPLDRAVKSTERMQLLRAAVPLIAAGLGIAWLYPWLATSSGMTVFWVGAPLGLMGSGCAAIGYRRRLREIGSDAPSTGRHYGWLFGGGALVLAAAAIPPYTYA